MRAIIGLGNPGRRYQMTRHNVGFILLEYIQSRNDIFFKPGKGDFYFCETLISNLSILLIKPTTYMNLSGIAVHQVIEQYSLDKKDILVVYDDFNLPYGTLRLRGKGSSGGHNGIDSIISELESDHFARLKIGIGNEFEDAVKFVLSRFTKSEIEQLEKVMQYAYDALNMWISDGLTSAMNKFNRNVID